MKLSEALWADLKTDEQRANWLLLGRGYETGVVAQAIQNDLAMAYSRLAAGQSVGGGEATRYEQMRSWIQESVNYVNTHRLSPSLEFEGRQLLAVSGDSTPQPARQSAAVSADLYLQLTDAMGYTSGKDGIEFSPEEWAEALLKDATAFRAQSAAVECERCGLPPEGHTGAHWCDNQSFAAVGEAVADEQILQLIQRHEVYGYHPGAILEFARAVLALAAPAQPVEAQWISVDDRVPDHEQTVFISGYAYNDPAKGRYYAAAVYHSEGMFYDVETGDNFYRPTHWMETVEPAKLGIQKDGE